MFAACVESLGQFGVVKKKYPVPESETITEYVINYHILRCSTPIYIIRYLKKTWNERSLVAMEHRSIKEEGQDTKWRNGRIIKETSSEAGLKNMYNINRFNMCVY